MAAAALPEFAKGIPGLPLARLASVADRVRADTLVAAMTLEEQAGQAMMVGIGATPRGALPGAAARLLGELGPGAVLLFGFNVPEEAWLLSNLDAAIRDATVGDAAVGDAAASTAHPAPLVALDHEGGTVFRFSGGVTRLPSAQAMGSGPTERVGAYARAAGEELRALGVGLALAPVVELGNDENAAFLGTRTFGRDPARVARSVRAFVRGIQSRGVAAAAKHFPGNGAIDPHKGLPVLGMDRAAYEREALPGFRAAVRAGVSTVMLSHAILPSVDPLLNATFSPTLIGRELKGRLGFGGIVLTDDLHMAALSAPGTALPPAASTGNLAVRALVAGADMVMLSAPGEALATRATIAEAARSGRLARGRLSDAAARVITVKLAMGFVSRDGTSPRMKPVTAAELARIAARGPGSGP